jgi:hypothetical protein
MEEKPLDWFLEAYFLKEALQEVLPHLPSERAAAVIGEGLTELVEKRSGPCDTFYYTRYEHRDIIELMLRVSPDLLDKHLEKLRNMKGKCSVTALCHAGTPESIERVIQWYLETKDREIKEAIHSEVKNPAALPVLTKYMVESDDTGLREACARAVENIVADGYADEVPAFVWGALLKCLEDPDEVTRGVCARVLHPLTLREMLPRSRTEELQDMLCRYLSEKSSKHKVHALNMWREARIAGVDVSCPKEILPNLLGNAEPEVRRAAADILEVYPQPEALQKAREMLKYETEGRVREAIVGTLASLGYERDFDLLLIFALSPYSSYEEAFWARLALVRHPVYWKHLLKRINGVLFGREVLEAAVTIQAWRRGCILMYTGAGWKCAEEKRMSV